MSQAVDTPARVRNRLLARLGPAEAERLKRRMQPVQILAGQSLTDGEGPARSVYFPETAVASMLVSLRDGTTIEVGTVGSEGVVGLPVFLGAASHRFHVIGQVTGDGLRMDAETFRREVDRSPALHDVLHAYTQAFMIQLAQTVACNRHHPVEARAARWLLATSDRLGRGEFRLTQEFLAMMLGVHRPSVSLAAASLQRSGAISYRRGNIRIADRALLRLKSCECYEVVDNEFGELFP
jgi:CRP-like cAMP-binding protein